MTEAQKAGSLAVLFEKIQRDPNYRNEKMGRVFVPGTGSLRNHSIVFIGEAPGREEESQGSPFVGPAGRNLDKLLEHIGLSRNQVFITNLLKFRPITPGGRNRSPSPSEGRRAVPYLLRELTVLSPQLIVCLGLSSARTLLEDSILGMRSTNGLFFQKHGFTILVTYHPSPFNFTNLEKRTALFQAFQRVREMSAGGKKESPCLQGDS
jgi:uracil-DNA glycosylase family 4